MLRRKKQEPEAMNRDGVSPGVAVCRDERTETWCKSSGVLNVSVRAVESCMWNLPEWMPERGHDNKANHPLVLPSDLTMIFSHTEPSVPPQGGLPCEFLSRSTMLEPSEL